MNYGSLVFGGINLIQTGLEIIERSYPSANPLIYNNDTLKKLDAESQKKLRRIEALKDAICNNNGISKENIKICLQDRGIIEAHGSLKNGIIGISRSLLAIYEPQNVKTNDRPLEKSQRKQFRDFLNSLPDDPEELLKIIKLRLNEQNGDEYADRAEKFFLDLSDKEIKFILSHEILGHLKNDDFLVRGISSSITRWSAFILAMNLETAFQFPLSSFILQALFWGISNVALQSVVQHRQEKNADIAALNDKQNVRGAKKFFKRLMAYHLLKKYRKAEHATPEHKFQILTNTEGENPFNFIDESARTRFLVASLKTVIHQPRK